MIRDAVSDDAQAICAIYNPYIENTVITFEEQPVAVEEMRARVREVTASHPWLVFEEQGTVVGYAYAKPWHARSAYRFCVESTVYLDPLATGRGIGRRLYEALLARLRPLQVHTVLGVIALPNPASVALHERLGFTEVGRLQEVGRKFERWVDVGFWQRPA